MTTCPYSATKSLLPLPLNALEQCYVNKSSSGRLAAHDLAYGFHWNIQNNRQPFAPLVQVAGDGQVPGCYLPLRNKLESIMILPNTVGAQRTPSSCRTLDVPPQPLIVQRALEGYVKRLAKRALSRVKTWIPCSFKSSQTPPGQPRATRDAG